MNRFEGRRVVHTGGASGIGRATVLRLVAEGATVVTIDRDADGLAETAATATSTGRVHTHVADLADEEQIISAAAAAVETLGGVDVLVNGAGIMAPGAAASTSLADYRRLLDINFLAPVAMCRELLPRLPDGSGVIVNVCSTSATRAHPGMTGYAASKGALLSYSLTLAAELAPRQIRVVPISPGGVATPLSASVAEAEGIDFAWYARIFPLWSAMGEPADIAAAIAFAASADAGYVNGVEMRVDGGSHT